MDTEDTRYWNRQVDPDRPLSSGLTAGIKSFAEFLRQLFSGEYAENQRRNKRGVAEFYRRVNERRQ